MRSEFLVSDPPLSSFKRFFFYFFSLDHIRYLVPSTSLSSACICDEVLLNRTLIEHESNSRIRASVFTTLIILYVREFFEWTLSRSLSSGCENTCSSLGGAKAVDICTSSLLCSNGAFCSAGDTYNLLLLKL